MEQTREHGQLNLTNKTQKDKAEHNTQDKGLSKYNRKHKHKDLTQDIPLDTGIE